MCDTMVAVGRATKDGKIIFAKNSDRDSNEAQLLIRYPRRKYDLRLNPVVKTTYLEIPQAAETYEVILSRPAWMWGCEMGFNEFGVVIGNEAVFTRQPKGKPALTGMDMIRLALERNRSAREALDYIIELLGRYGQGGNCSAEKKMEYHNSFLIADQKEAYVLETAGKYWAYRQIQDGVYVISNGLTLTNDFDACHPDLIRDSIARKMCTGLADFSFRRLYSEPIYTHFSGCAVRRDSSMNILNAEYSSITPHTMRRALCAHHGRDGSFASGSMHSVCCHAGGLISSQTTASLIAIPQDREYWYTGGSLPCVSLFKPLWMGDPFFPFSDGDEDRAVRYWTRHEQVVRMLLDHRLDVDPYRAALAGAQSEIDRRFETSRDAVSQRKNFETDIDFTASFLEKGSAQTPGPLSGNRIFKSYWKKTNAAFNRRFQ